MAHRIDRKKRLGQFVFSTCHAELSCPFDEAGTAQACPTCRTQFTVPGKSDVAIIVGAEARDADARRKEDDRRLNEERARVEAQRQQATPSAAINPLYESSR